MIRLNLGCGNKVMPGWVNIDLHVKRPHVYTYDVRALPYQSATVDEILAEDILEHFPRLEWRAVLAEWVRVLRPGGMLTIQFPDMRILCQKLLDSRDEEEWEIWNRKIFGGQGDGGPGEGLFHYTGFDGLHLERYCQGLGFDPISRTISGTNCTLVMQKR